MTKLIYWFLLARFQLNYLLDFLSQPKKLSKALENLPRNIEHLYDDVMRRIENSSNCDKDLAIRTLSWVFHTADRPGARPLQLEELCDLLTTDEDDVEFASEFRVSSDDVVDVCRSLVVPDDKTGIVAFAHFSVHEYFRGSKYLRPVSELAKICLSYLSFDEFEKDGPCLVKEALDARVNKYKAAGFAAKYWGFYAQAAQELPIVQDAALQLLTSANKRMSAFEMDLYYSGDWVEPLSREYLYSMKLLHYLSMQGMARLCKLVLDGTLWKNRYILYKVVPNAIRITALDDVHVHVRNSEGDTPLHYAASLDHTDTLKVFLEEGADINVSNKSGETPLLVAIVFRKVDATCLLLDRGASVDVKDRSGLTPLHYAAIYGDCTVLKALLARDPELESKADNGYTALHYAATREGRESILVSLFQAIRSKSLDGPSSADVGLISQPSDVSSSAIHDAKTRADLVSQLCDFFPTDHIYPRVLGQLFWAEKKYDCAVGCYERSIENNPANDTISRIEEIAHTGFVCDDCRQAIIGFRHACTKCASFDLCRICYQKPIWPRHDDKTHEMRIIPRQDWKPVGLRVD